MQIKLLVLDSNTWNDLIVCFGLFGFMAYQPL